MTTARPPAVDLNRLLANNPLPALPQSALRLLELSRDAENGPAEFAQAIEADPGLAGQVLRFVNSSFFGFAREISNLRLGIALVGVRTIKNFSLWSAVFSVVPNPRCGALEVKSLWQDSLRRALLARAVAGQLGAADAEEAFAAALLQDMAVPLLAKELSRVYDRLLPAREQGRFRLSYLEGQVLGFDHAAAGALMAAQWNLPAVFATLIGSHAAAAADTTDPAARAVQLSSLLPAACDPRWVEAHDFAARYEALRGGGPDAAALLAAVDRQFADFAPVLKLSTGGPSLVEAFEQAAAAV